jgi:hypothetical protein
VTGSPFDHNRGVDPIDTKGSLVRALRDESRVLEGARPGHSALYAAAADAIESAQKGLLRALDFRTASPHGLDIKADVRQALHDSGFRGPMGEVDSPV